MTEAKSAQPQLPPRLETYIDRTVERIKPGEDTIAIRYMAALEAENESLKAQLEERNNRGTGFLYVPKAAYEVVKAERDKMLEVIREYRDNASGHGCNCEYFKDDTCEDDTRCPTCIKADALLSKEETK